MLDATTKQFSAMNSTSEQNNRDYAALNISNAAINGRLSVDKNGEVFVNNLRLHVCSKQRTNFQFFYNILLQLGRG